MDKNEYEKQIDEALNLRDAGQLQESLCVISKIVGQIPREDVKTLRIVGVIFLDGKDFQNAFQCFQKALEIDPTSASASIGLFHTLWNMGRYSDGLAELRRFLSVSQSEEHFKLIEEMSEVARREQDNE